MTELHPTDYLHKLFLEHGVPSVVQDDWVVPNSELPALRAIWHPGESTGRLDIQALVRDKVVIEESFAGIGQGASGMGDALSNFTINSFHVLLAALWGKNDPEQVTTEEWSIGGKRYAAFIGNFGTRDSENATAHVPQGLFAQIEAAIKRAPLSEDIHWFRFFFANFANEFTFEALKDNEHWDAGKQRLEAATWERSDGYYSVRLFVVLRAASFSKRTYTDDAGRIAHVSRWTSPFADLKRAFKAMMKRQPKRRVIVADADGVALLEDERLLWKVEWGALEEIVAYKVDAVTVDHICLGFRASGDGEFLVVEEDWEGWDTLNHVLHERLGIHQAKWFPIVGRPAFKENRTVLWRRDTLQHPH
jgi:hypothetical protein